MAGDSKLTFERFGRSYHLRIRTAEDLRAIVSLDEALWVATGAPIETINCDRTFLELVDTDRNGRILCFELADAIAWLLKNLSDTSGVDAGRAVLSLAAINVGEEEGRRIHASAGKMLARLGADDAGEITLEQVRKIKAEVEATPVSGAGVVLPEAAEDPEVRQFIADVVATVGGAPHPGGAVGAAQAQLEQFLAGAQAYLEWRRQGELPPGQSRSEVMPLGEGTAAAYALLSGVRDKMDQYFAQCEAVALDAELGGRLGPRPAELEGMDFGDPAAIREVLKSAPLARARADRVLGFADPVNPHYAVRLAELRTGLIEPVLGASDESLSEDQWGRIKQAFAAHEAWVTSKAGSDVEPLGAEKLQAYLDPRFARAVRALMAASAETAFVLDNIRQAEKLILYQAYLRDLANNFVSFPHLYSAERRAMFELGTLIMDGRRFNLSVRVDNRAQHAAVAKSSNMYVLYVEIAPKGGGEKYEVAVPVTSGGKGNLCVGKRGVFEDVHGNECDARVMQIIENPISVGEALISPFQRMGRLVTGKIEAITTQAEKKLDTATAATVTQVRAGGPTAGAAPAQGSGMMAGGLLMGGGVAVAALGSAVAYFTKTLAGLQYWQILIGLGGAVLAVVVPISIIAALKLRRRDLSGILAGSGWAINARMRLTRGLGRFFTQRPRYPKEAKGVRRPRKWLILAAIVVLAAIAVSAYLYLRR